MTIVNERPFILAARLNDHEDDCACPDKAFVLSFDNQSMEFEQDCACPDQAFTLAYSARDATAFVQTPGVHIAELPHGFHLALSPFAPAGPSVLSHLAWERWQSFILPKNISEDIDFALVDQMLIQPVGTTPQLKAQQAESLTAWIHVTNACDLDCPYCYVQKSSARMTEAVASQTLHKIFESATRHGFRRVKLKYAGGEATLHFRLIQYMHEMASYLATQTNLDLREVVLSNGLHFSPREADWLVANKVKVMISIDGIGDLHDRLRRRKNGQGAFSQVENVIDKVLLPRGIRPDITMTITGLNARGAADVAHWALIERDLAISFNLYRQNLLTISRRELLFEEQTIIEGLKAAYAVIESQLPARPFLNGLLDRVQGEAHSYTCGVGQTYVVVSHTGEIAQCQMQINQSTKTTSSDDFIPLITVGAIQNLSVHQKHGCRDCEFRYRCSGGCPLETYRATGRWDVQSPNCRIYKTLLPDALRLEGLRLLKVNGYVS